MAKKQDNRYLALLRGINVGGKNIIAKDDLKQCFENIGLESVRTYIQSGNVLFRSKETDDRKLTSWIEAALSKQFHYQAHVVVFSRNQFESDVQSAPKNWGIDETKKHNALFLLRDLRPIDVMEQLPSPVKKHETVGMAKSTLFWSTSKDYKGKTTLMKLARMPVYKQMTVRNHNTTMKLLALFEEI